MANQTYITKFAKNGNSTSLRCVAIMTAAVAAMFEELKPSNYLGHSDTGIKSIMRNVVASLTFSVKHIILAAMFYLSLIMINTLAREFVAFVVGAFCHGQVPFWIGLELMQNLIWGTDFSEVLKNRQNMYAIATRKRVSINEAVNETLHALKLQVCRQ